MLNYIITLLNTPGRITPEQTNYFAHLAGYEPTSYRTDYTSLVALYRRMHAELLGWFITGHTHFIKGS